MAPYPKAERERLTDEAIAFSLRGWSTVKIEAELGVTRKTISGWMDNEFSRRAEHRDQDKERAIARYETVIEAAWTRYERMKDASLNTSGLLNVIKSCQDSINKITGAEAPIKHQEVDEEIVIVWEDLDSYEEIEAAAEED